MAKVRRHSPSGFRLPARPLQRRQEEQQSHRTTAQGFDRGLIALPFAGGAALAVEEVPWGDSKRTLTKAYMLFLVRWARRLSWKETADAFRTSWDKVFDAVEHVVIWGLVHRTLGQIDAIGVDEIQYAKGHQYLTLVYQIDIGLTRLLWVGKERTIESFQGFFTSMRRQVISKICFVCSDMWEPYLKLIRQRSPRLRVSSTASTSSPI